MDEALAEQQREAYKMAGVDDDEPAIDPSKKRKAVEDEKVSLSATLALISRGALLILPAGERKEAEEREEGARQHRDLRHLSSGGC
jgi:hypothetical protein